MARCTAPGSRQTPTARPLNLAPASTPPMLVAPRKWRQRQRPRMSTITLATATAACWLHEPAAAAPAALPPLLRRATLGSLIFSCELILCCLTSDFGMRFDFAVMHSFCLPSVSACVPCLAFSLPVNSVCVVQAYCTMGGLGPGRKAPANLNCPLNWALAQPRQLALQQERMC